MSLFPYTGPMTSADIFADVYRRSNRSLSCSDRMCGAEDCETCRGPQEEPEPEQQEESVDDLILDLSIGGLAKIDEQKTDEPNEDN